MGTTGDIAASAAPAATPDTDTPRLAEGIELIGEFEDSGFKEPPLLARRADGQVVQLTRLLFLVAEACDGRDVEAIAGVVTERYGRGVSVDNVRFLVEKKLRPLGVLAQADGSTPEMHKRAPLLALRHRRAVLSEPAVDRAARALAWLHRRPLVALVLLAVVAFDVWLFGVHGMAGGLRSALYTPWLLVGVLASVVLATAFHEFGHASACRYGGACPGVVGVGVYLVWPAFYCDVTDAYRLNRAGRLRTDLGGVYFNAIFVLLAGGFYFVTGVEAALVAAFLQHLIILQQLLPLLRFDGYYVLSDLTGVPDILSRIKPIFRSLVPKRALEPQVAELKPWVRIVVTAYLIAIIPTLAFLLVWIVMAMPRIVATAYDSMGLQLDRVRSGAGADEVVLGGFQMVALTMPLAAMSLSLGRTGKLAGRGLIRWASGNTARTVATAMSTVAVLAAAGYVLWPNGDYEPIRPGERGTVGEAVESLPAATTGRPFFTPERAERYEPVPTVREQRSPLGRGRSDEEPAAPRSGPGAPDGRDTPADRSEDAVPPSRAGEGPDTEPGATSTPSAPGAATPAPAPGGPASPEPGATADPGATAEPTATPTPIATATPAGTPEADQIAPR